MKKSYLSFHREVNELGKYYCSKLSTIIPITNLWWNNPAPTKFLKWGARQIKECSNLSMFMQSLVHNWGCASCWRARRKKRRHSMTSKNFRSDQKGMITGQAGICLSKRRKAGIPGWKAGIPGWKAWVFVQARTQKWRIGMASERDCEEASLTGKEGLCSE